MIHDLENVKKMFKDADEIIRKRPELLSMNVDYIFDELDDGTQEMIHNRWGVMTRVKMKEIKCFDNKGIIDFLASVEERNLLCEYIGYILQNEYQISLLSILLDAYTMGVHGEILPFVKWCLEYEEQCYIEKIDDILGIIDTINDNDKFSFIQGYAVLVLNNQKEEIVLKKFLDSYSDSLEQLVLELGNILYPKYSTEAEKWLDIYINEEAKYCKKIGIHFLCRSLLYDCDSFEEHFLFLEENLCSDQELWEQLIIAYVRYMLYKEKGQYINESKKRLLVVRNGSLNEKRICIREIIHYRVKQLEEYIEIIESIISVSFDRDNQILKDLDYYFNYIFSIDSAKCFRMLYQVYEINEYSNGKKFLSCLSKTCRTMKDNQDIFINMWWDKFMYGSKLEFLLSVEIFSKVIALDKINYLLENITTSKEDLICLLEGIYLFAIDEKKIVNLAFIISSHIKDRNYFTKYCIDNIFSNYSSALLDAAKEYKNNDDGYKSNLATDIIEYYDLCKEKIQKGYEDKDFMPPTNRRIIYQKAMIEHNKKIQKQAEEHSILAQFFPTRKMKYGSRLAFIQTQKKGKLHYSVSEYAKQSVSMELPKVFLNDPIKHIYMKMEYLKKRGTNETNS